MDLKLDISEGLRSALLKRNWTQADLARRSGISPATLSQLLKGVIDPRVTTLEKLCHSLSSTPNELLGVETEMDVLLRRENEALIRVKDAVLEAGRLWERENPAFTYKGHLRGPGQPAKVYGGGREPGIDGVLANPENLLVDP